MFPVAIRLDSPAASGYHQGKGRAPLLRESRRKNRDYLQQPEITTHSKTGTKRSRKRYFLKIQEDNRIVDANFRQNESKAPRFAQTGPQTRARRGFGRAAVEIDLIRKGIKTRNKKLIACGKHTNE